MDPSKIIQHLVDISQGVCSITEESVLKLKNKEDQMIELGLLTLFEEIEHNKGKLEDSIREKEILLQEIHHRVKNNLQIISSLIKLQQFSLDDGKTKSLLRDCRSRINTMSIIHEKVLTSNNLGNVNYKEYVEDLVMELKRTYSHSPEGLDIRLDIDPLTLCMDTAIPLGLVINEIFTNSMKYGLKENGKSDIYLQLKEHEPNSFEMKIGDNGSGYSNKIFKSDKNTLGVQLIRGLVSQIDGTIEKLKVSTKKGTHYQIYFEEPVQ